MGVLSIGLKWRLVVVYRCSDRAGCEIAEGQDTLVIMLMGIWAEGRRGRLAQDGCETGGNVLLQVLWQWPSM